VGTVGAAFAATPALTAEIPELSGALPAVSGPNGKFGIAGGLIDRNDVKTDGRFHVMGSYSIPIDHAWGAQFDGNIGDLGGSTTGSVGLHLFTRDPDSYLLGINTAYAAIGSNDIIRLGPEFEWYSGNLSFESWVGFEDSDKNDSAFFAHLNIAFYPDPNAKLYVGFRRTLHKDAGAIGFEWLTRLSPFEGAPASLFAEGQIGEKGHASVWAGLRFYFGSNPDKTLIRRHREDDPADKTLSLNQLAGQCQDDGFAQDAEVADGVLPSSCNTTRLPKEES
jgi:hypothetical protein